MDRFNTWKSVTAAYPDALILIPNITHSYFNDIMLAQYEKAAIEYYYPWSSEDSPTLSAKRRKKRWDHFFSACQRVWVKVVLWAPMMSTQHANTISWGWLHTPSFLGHRNAAVWGVHRRQCIPTMPVLCDVAIPSLNILYDPPSTEQILPDFCKALRRRVDLYCKLKAGETLTEVDVMLKTQRDVDLDRLGFAAVCMGLNNRTPGVLFLRKALRQTEFQDAVLMQFLSWEVAIAVCRLKYCLSSYTLQLFAKHTRLEVMDKETHRLVFPSLDSWSTDNPHSWVSRSARTLQYWVRCPFERAAVLLRERAVYLQGGQCFLHIGQIFHLLTRSILHEVIKEHTSWATDSSGVEMRDSRLIPVLREQLGRVWQSVSQGPEDEGFIRGSTVVADLASNAPPCIKRMILTLSHASTLLPPLNHHNEFLFLSLALRYGVRPEELIQLLCARVRSQYPHTEWKAKDEDIVYQVRHLDRSRKAYDWTCRQMQQGPKPFCVYTQQPQPQRMCVSKLPSDFQPQLLRSPWMYIVAKKKSRGDVVMDTR